MVKLIVSIMLLSSACSEYEISPKTDTPVGGIDTGYSDGPSWPTEDDTGDEEPTCDDFSPDPIGPVASLDDCLAEPEVGSFTPEVEWQWSVNEIHIGYDNLMATPAIANLDDDNGDGAVNADDIPDVVFTSFAGSSYSSPGTITAIRGDGGETLWSVSSPGGHPIYGAAGVAIGDLEGDGTIEVCTAGTSAGVICLNGVDGSFKWAGGAEMSAYGCPSIADLDGDGLAEVIFGRTILDHTGATIATGTAGRGGPHFMSFAVDWDLDGQLEVIAGNTVYEMDGTIIWNEDFDDAAPAVGDFNMDGRPDLVRAGSGWVRVTLNDGTLLWSLATTGGGNAGAPTVADFDGDGLPEVGVADLSTYTVYDTDGTPMWSNTTSDYSSSKTGSSVFDFEGDGAAEVVYADEHTLWIYDGATGAVKMAQEGHASGTLMEYPLIADVDNDGSTEIIVASNDYTFSGWTGITVIGDVAESWAPARPIWNQYAYHITNVNNDGSIPAVQTQNWITWNNFRAGGTELGPSHWLTDLVPRPPDICTATCDLDEVTVYLPVVNHGIIEARDVVVAFERGDGTQVDVKNIPSILDGTGVQLGPIRISLDEWGDGPLFAIVDWPEDIAECREDNNRHNLGRWPCP